MTVYEDCQAALEEHLLLCPDLPLRSDGLTPAVAWENTDYQIEAGRNFLRVQFFTYEIPKGGIGKNGMVAVSGMFYISILTPGGIGSAPANELAGQLLLHFKSGQNLPAPDGPHVVRTRKCWRGSAIVENAGWFLLPITVDWYCHTESL